MLTKHVEQCRIKEYQVSSHELVLGRKSNVLSFTKIQKRKLSECSSFPRLTLIGGLASNINDQLKIVDIIQTYRTWSLVLFAKNPMKILERDCEE